MKGWEGGERTFNILTNLAAVASTKSLVVSILPSVDPSPPTAVGREGWPLLPFTAPLGSLGVVSLGGWSPWAGGMARSVVLR